MHRKEMVNQLLFGDTVKVLKEKGDMWVKIRSLHDNYEGWMTTSMLESIDAAAANTMSAYVCTDILSDITVGDREMKIPVGSSLPFFTESKGRLGANEYVFNGNYWKRDEQQPSEELLI